MMKAVKYANLTTVLALVMSAGCAFQQEKVEQQLAQPAPINCATAAGDIRMLQQEKANVAQQVVEGATAIYPGSLVVGLITGTESTKLQVATGEYDKMIDKRIAEIKQACPGN
jgi:hypothetical protein